MKILIAGGAGYVGSSLVPRLLDRGYQVDILDLLWFGQHLPKGTKVIRQDIMEIDEGLLQGYDQVIFLAGLSNDPMAEYSPSKNFIANAAAPAYLAYLAKRCGVRRYIYAGSCSVYGYAVDELYDEETRAISDYPYGISKLQGESASLQLADETFSVIALRKGTVCGYSPRMRLDLVVNTMFKTALTQGVITVNNPAIWRPILALQDAVSAYVRAIECGPEISGIFNVASGNYTVGEIADYVKKAVEEETGRTIRLEIKHLQEFRSYKVEVAKAMRVLSFKPQHDIEAIVRDLFANLKKFEDFDHPSYYNIRTFKSLEESARREHKS
jgi:nucleoside-diphosphate-sugar epimerase